MQIVKSETITPGAKSFLIIGPEKTGKTSFLGSIVKYLAAQKKRSLVLACEEGTLKRLGGLPELDFVQCYVTKEDLAAASTLPTVKACTDQEKKAKELMKAAKNLVWKRFVEAHSELLLNPTHGYTFCGFDSANYFQDILLDRLEDVNNKTGFDLWRDARKMTAGYIEQLLPTVEYYCVTVHVKTADDDTVNKEMFTAAFQGSYRDVVGGKFDMVAHSVTRPAGDKVNYMLQVLPDGMHKAGIRVPFGSEEAITKEMPNDFAKIQEIMLKGVKK